MDIVGHFATQLSRLIALKPSTRKASSALSQQGQNMDICGHSAFSIGAAEMLANVGIFRHFLAWQFL